MLCHVWLSSSEQFCADVLTLAREARRRPMGVFHPTFSLLRAVKESLLEKLPADAHHRASGRLCVSLTRVADGKNVLVSEFNSREELIQVELSTTMVSVLLLLKCDIVSLTPVSSWGSDVQLVSCTVGLYRFSCAAAFSLFTVVSSLLHTMEWWAEPLHFSNRISRKEVIQYGFTVFIILNPL